MTRLRAFASTPAFGFVYMATALAATFLILNALGHELVGGTAKTVVWSVVMGLAELGGVLARRLRDRTPAQLTEWAAWIAGSSRPHLRDEWLAVLAGVPEEGIVLSLRERRRLAAGFVLSSLRMRVHDAGRPVWRPVDWLLSAESRTNAFITTAVGGLVIYFCRTDGFHALIANRWESCAGFATGLFLFTRWLRRVRGIELAVQTRQDRS